MLEMNTATIYVDVFFYFFSSTNKTVTIVQTISVFKDHLTPKYSMYIDKKIKVKYIK